MGFGLDEEKQEHEIIEMETAKQKRRPPFAYWEVGGREYKLKLNTEQVCRLEEKYKRNLLELIMGGSIPPLGIMLAIVQGAMAPWEHSIKYQKVQALFDQYTEEGGTQLTLFSDVILEIMKVSGFFTESQVEDMDKNLEQAKELM